MTTKAAAYGALVGETVMKHLGGLLGWNPAHANEEQLGDLIANLLHWGERQGIIGDDDSDTDAAAIIDSALNHYWAEQGKGDDLANDDHYDQAIALLELRRTIKA